MKITFNPVTKLFSVNNLLKSFSKYRKGQTSFNHYTNSKSISDIIKYGLVPIRYGGISGYLDKDDSIKRTMTDWKSLSSMDDRDDILDLQRKKSDMLKRHKNNISSNDDKYIEYYIDPKLKPIVHYNSIDGINSDTPVRVVTPVNLNEREDGVNINVNKNGDRIIQKNKAKRDLDESLMYPNKSIDIPEVGNMKSISSELLKLQLPYGAVTKNNYKRYESDLGDIDPSRFDVNDTYTRRIYNLYAKKNNLPLLSGSDKYRSK